MFFCERSGNWTTTLENIAGLQQGNVPDYVDILVRGPHGAPAQHVGQYENVVLISDVSATPFASITKFAHHWIMNYTKLGLDTSNSAYTAFKYNRSARNSAPNTPGRSRPVSRNVSRTHSRPTSRSASRVVSRSVPLSRSLTASKLQRGDYMNSVDRVTKD